MNHEISDGKAAIRQQRAFGRTDQADGFRIDLRKKQGRPVAEHLVVIVRDPRVDEKQPRWAADEFGHRLILFLGHSA